MLSGIQLQLRTGAQKAAPVPRATIEALDAIEVRVEPEQSTFQLTFGVDRARTLLDGFLPVDAPPSPLRVIVVVTVNGSPDVLVDGMVTHQELNPGDAGGRSTLTVTGEDLTVLMTREELTGTPFAGMEPQARIARILDRYAPWGIRAEVVKPALRSAANPAQATAQQHGHDLDYIRQLATRVGHVFYLRPTTQPGVTTAYWGPQLRGGATQKPISVDMDSRTNADGLSFTFDHTSREDPQVRVQDPSSLQSRKLPPADPATVDKPLGRQATPVFRKPIVADAAGQTASDATLLAQGIATRSAEAVTAKGKLSVIRYGGLLRARELVALRGVGTAFNGLWWVDSVTHAIRRDAYEQSFTLKRNALVSSITRVAS